MAKKAKRSRAGREEFWRDLIERQQQSGQSIREFCDDEKVSQPSFFSWRKRLRSENARPKSRFLPVQIDLADSVASPGRIEILLDGGKRVRVEPGFDPQAWRKSWRSWSDRRAEAQPTGADLPVCTAHRHAARVRRVDANGGGASPTECPRRRTVCVREPAQRPDQAVVLGRGWVVHLVQAPRIGNGRIASLSERG